MLQPRIWSPLRRILLNPPSARQLNPLARPPIPRLPARPFTTTPIPRLPAPPTKPRQPPSDTQDEKPFVPKPLGRPIGFKSPPRPGENTGTEPKAKKNYSGMTMSERNLAKRGELVEKWGSNYFRDFVNIRKYRSGKTFLANARIFKRDAAMYFPNFHGKSLEKGKEGNRDTTNVLKGRVSVVNVYSSEWGHTQVRSFTSPKVNPGLHDVLRKHKDVAQMVDINIEENILKAWIISFFSFNLRNNMKKEDWGRYFVVRRGVSQKVRETIGLLNKRVGYVYLVDEECRIRWAGSADAEGTEKEDLTKGFARLIEEAGTGGSKIVPPVRIKGEGKGEKPLPVPLPIAFK